MKYRPILALLLALLPAALLLGGCGASATPEETPAPAATPGSSLARRPIPSFDPNRSAATETPPAPTPAPVPTPEPTPEPTPAPEAYQLNVTVSDDGRPCPYLTDGYETSTQGFAPGAELTLTAGEPVGSLYLIWSSRPAPWSLTADGETLAGGTEGFFHEYLELPEPTETLTLSLPAEGRAELREVYAFSPGTPPDWVQRWLPPCDTADLLLFVTHSDDEFIYFGGMLPRYAGGEGLEVQVAYLVDHYAYERHRWNELLNGLWHAGVRHYPVCAGFPDSLPPSLEQIKAAYGEENVLHWQVEQLRRFRPLVVATHAENGEYLNFTHMLCALCAEQAVVLAEDPEQFPESAERWGTWRTPKLYVHLYGDGPTVVDYETPLETLGGKTAFEVAEECYRLYTSQLAYAYRVYGADYPQFDSHLFGLCRSLVGEDEAKTDLMEHIDKAEWRS